MNYNRTNFEGFDKANPEVWELFEKFTLMATKRLKHYSARAVLHRIRWETNVETTGTTFKINNIWSKDYAIKFMNKYPQHDGFFRLRNKQ
jgi:hypothetical protein|tara:strand:- start:1254 stop:1523 length:270 start_codon:yes stop_codon:yes gene_type:complete